MVHAVCSYVASPTDAHRDAVLRGRPLLAAPNDERPAAFLAGLAGLHAIVASCGRTLFRPGPALRARPQLVPSPFNSLRVGPGGGCAAGAPVERVLRLAPPRAIDPSGVSVQDLLTNYLAQPCRACAPGTTHAGFFHAPSVLALDLGEGGLPLSVADNTTLRVAGRPMAGGGGGGGGGGEEEEPGPPTVFYKLVGAVARSAGGYTGFFFTHATSRWAQAPPALAGTPGTEGDDGTLAEGAFTRHMALLIYDRVGHDGHPIPVTRDVVPPTRIAQLQRLLAQPANGEAAGGFLADQRALRRLGDAKAGRPHAGELHALLKERVVGHCALALRAERKGAPARSAASWRQHLGAAAPFPRLDRVLTATVRAAPAPLADGAPSARARAHYLNAAVFGDALHAFLADCGAPPDAIAFALARSPLVQDGFFSTLGEGTTTSVQLAVTQCGLGELPLNDSTGIDQSSSFSQFFLEAVARAVRTAHPGRILLDLPMSILSCPLACAHGAQPPPAARPLPARPLPPAGGEEEPAGDSCWFNSYCGGGAEGAPMAKKATFDLNSEAGEDAMRSGASARSSSSSTSSSPSSSGSTSTGCSKPDEDTELCFSFVFSFLVAPLLGLAGLKLEPFCVFTGRHVPVLHHAPVGSDCLRGQLSFFGGLQIPGHAGAGRGQPAPRAITWTAVPHPGALRFLAAASKRRHALALPRRALLAASWCAALYGVAFPSAAVRSVAAGPIALALAADGRARLEVSRTGARFGATMDALLTAVSWARRARARGPALSATSPATAPF
jgi:hypothetical protein